MTSKGEASNDGTWYQVYQWMLEGGERWVCGFAVGMLYGVAEVVLLVLYSSHEVGS